MATLPDTARALLERKARGHVVTRNGDGGPQVTMVWIDGDDLLFKTAEGAKAQIDRLAKKYLGLDSYLWRRPDERRLTVSLAVERIGGAGPWVEAS